VIGVYPTSVEPLGPLSRPGCALWIKRDDKTGVLYGGNKIRKLEHLLDDARRRGATRLVTLGAVGSHHVLATTIYGAQAGFAVEAVLVPQPRTDHVVANVRAGLAHGLRAVPAGSYAMVPFRIIPRLLAAGAYRIDLGGSSVTGSMGYVDAARELAAQVRAGAMPEPDLIVVALGSGGTAAGLAAGLELEGLASRVVGVCVSKPAWLLGWMARSLARACVRRAGGRTTSRAIADRLVIDGRYIGRGYGHPTEKGARAMEAAARVGIALDPTYTAKAFAAALDRVDAGGVKTVLYWHTLSSAPMAPLLEGAAAEAQLDAGVRGLLT
jgi:1-aminocyclopropane-1-carboxylate deaminase/D-cysteine desulfhydrase-like pyridoxal-dependent ACC family enzyme